MREIVKTGCRTVRPRLFRGGWLLAAALAVAGGNASAQQDDEDFATGLSFLPEAEYLEIPEAPRYRQHLPPSVDLSRFYPRVGQQGREGSCVSWAVGYAARGYLEGRARRTAPPGPSALASPEFLHNLSRREINRRKRPKRGQECEGNFFSTAFYLLKTHGSLSHADMPYDDSGCDNLPPSSTIQQLKTRSPRPFAIRDWLRLSSLNEVKTHLARGDAVVAGIRTPKSFMRYRRKAHSDTYSYTGGPIGGGHAIALVGYDERRRAIKLMNSWGTGWGSDGFAWMDYTTFNKLAQERYAMFADVEVDPPPPNNDDDPSPSPLPPNVDPVRPAPPPIPPLTRKLRRIAKQFQCSTLRVEGGGSWHVEGFVQSKEDAELLKQRSREAAGEEIVSFDVDIRPWPQCEALETLEVALDDPRGLGITAAGASADVRLSEGDVLAISARTPDFPAYLYLSYVQQDGTVVHLEQPASSIATPREPFDSLVFGDGKEGRPTYRVSPPFGNELVIAVASASPLFDKPRPRVDGDRDYLTVLRQALLQRERAITGRRIVAAIMSVETKP